MLGVGHHGVGAGHQVGRQTEVECLVGHQFQHLVVLEVALQNILVGGEEDRQELEEARVFLDEVAHVRHRAGRHLKEGVEGGAHQVIGEGAEISPARAVLGGYLSDDSAGILRGEGEGDALAIGEEEGHDGVAGDEVHLLLQGGAEGFEDTLDGFDDLDDGCAHIEAVALALKG